MTPGEVMEKLLADMKGRSGFDELFSGIDDETLSEMYEKWHRIVSTALDATRARAHAEGLEAGRREMALVVSDPDAEPWKHLRETLKLLLVALTEQETEEVEMRVRELLVLLAGAPDLLTSRIRSLIPAAPEVIK